MSQNNISARWVIGILLLVIGGMLLLERVSLFSFNFYMPWWVFSWHTMMIIIGVIILTTTSNRSAGIIVIAIGVFTMLPHWWPLLLILLGAYLLTRGKVSDMHFTSMNSSIGNDPDFIDVVTIFGGTNKIFQSGNFRGGNITAIFGGSDINLYGCKLAEGVSYIEVTTIFGGSSIQAPSDWNIQIDVTPIFGGAEDKRIKSPNIVLDTTRVLVIKGATIFGGIDIKN